MRAGPGLGSLILGRKEGIPKLTPKERGSIKMYFSLSIFLIPLIKCGWLSCPTWVGWPVTGSTRAVIAYFLLSIGTNQFCIAYNENCYFDSFRLYKVTDKLNGIFKLDNFFINSSRAISFNIIQRSERLKKFITNFSMGF